MWCGSGCGARPVGLTYGGEWFLEPAGPDFSFEGAALYVIIALPLGLLLAVLSSLRPGDEVITVVTVLVAAAIGAVVMYAVGHGLGPPDPQALAAGQPDFTPLPGDLVLSSSTPGETTVRVDGAGGHADRRDGWSGRGLPPWQ